MAKAAFIALLVLNALFETFFAVNSFVNPDAIVDPENTRALWWLQAYAVAILALSLVSVMGWFMRHEPKVATWIAAILTFFHTAQFSGVVMNNPAPNPGWVHGLVALIGLTFLLISRLEPKRTP